MDSYMDNKRDEYINSLPEDQAIDFMIQEGVIDPENREAAIHDLMEERIHKQNQIQTAWDAFQEDPGLF